MNRNICEVIKRVIAELPTDKENLKLELNNISESARYTAPEAMYIRWEQFYEALVNNLNTPEKWDFEFRIGKIVRGEAESV